VTSLDALSAVRLWAPPLRRRQHGFTLWIKSCDVTPDENTRHTREMHPLMPVRRGTIVLLKQEMGENKFFRHFYLDSRP